MEEAWSNFLTMANRAYTKLEQGAKDNGKHRAWFGRQKHERRQDPSLRYIKNARDADEHGLERITERASGGIGIKFSSRRVLNQRSSNADILVEDRLHWNLRSSSEISVHAYPAGVKLIAVTNYSPPPPPPPRPTHSPDASPCPS